MLSNTTAERPPGPSIAHLRGMREDPLGFPIEMQRRWGQLVFSPVGPGFRPTFFLFNPETVEQVLVTRRDNYVKSLVLRRLKAVFGESVLTSEGDLWKRSRRLLAPAFHRKALMQYVEAMDRCTTRAVDRMLTAGRFPLQQHMMELTLDIAMECFFGSSAAGVTERVDRGMTDILGYADLAIGTLVQVPTWLPHPRANRFRRGMRTLTDVVNELIAQRRARGEEREDVLGLLLAARDEDGSGLTDQEIRDEVITLLLAGHETTALALTYTLFLLSHRPALVAQLRDEMAREIPDGAAPDYAALGRLRLQEQCFKESLRLYPPVGIIGREAVAADELEGWKIPAGAQMIISMWAIQHDPRYYEEPWAYRPERWTEAFERELPRYAFFPFGGGHRVCIGDAFAKLEARVVLYRVLERLDLQPEQTDLPPMNLAVTMRPERDVFLTARARR